VFLQPFSFSNFDGRGMIQLISHAHFFLHLGALAAFEFDFRLMRISQKKFVFLPITAAMVVF